MFRRFSLGVLLLATASCSGAGTDGNEGSRSKGDTILVGDPDSPDDAPPVDDACANVRLAGPDGVCDFDGPYVECDADCVPEDLPVTDICSTVFIIPDGLCDPTSTLAECDPDCNGSAEPPGDCGPPEDPEAAPEPDHTDDPCAAIFVIPDGQCDAASPYAVCDPDCSQQ